jgi:hypothetical protein
MAIEWRQHAVLKQIFTAEGAGSAERRTADGAAVFMQAPAAASSALSAVRNVFSG